MTGEVHSTELRVRYAVLAIGILLWALVWWLPAGAPGRGEATDAVALSTLLVILGAGACASTYGSSSGRGLGLGAVALPPLLYFEGGRLAAPAAVSFLAIAWVFARLRPGLHRADSLEKWADRLGIRLIAVIAAGFAWNWVSGTSGAAAFGPGLLSGLGYLGLLTAAELARRGAAGRPSEEGADYRYLGYEAGGWSAGVVAVMVFSGSGRVAGIAVLGMVALLALELARLERARELALAGARAMQEVHLAGHRIIFGESEPLAIARQIFGECRRLVTFSWFQLTMIEANGEQRSWFSGPDGWVREGVPEPPPRPAALPGIHRRVSWQILERDLSVPGRRLGAIRMWCDPRQQRPGAVGWLDALLPQMASSVHSVVLDREARQDPLTGLADRRALEERLQNVHAAAVALGAAMAVLMVDLDKFKRINDLYGHATGDQALMAVAAVLEAHRRDKDLCARYGGEEFAVVLEDTGGPEALQVAERLREAVEQLVFKPHGKLIRLQLSAGVAAFPELHVKQAGELLELADEALYKAKKLGRNRCLLARGAGRFETVGGKIVGAAEKPAQPSIPTLFA